MEARGLSQSRGMFIDKQQTKKQKNKQSKQEKERARDYRSRSWRPGEEESEGGSVLGSADVADIV